MFFIYWERFSADALKLLQNVNDEEDEGGVLRKKINKESSKSNFLNCYAFSVLVFISNLISTSISAKWHLCNNLPNKLVIIRQIFHQTSWWKLKKISRVVWSQQFSSLELLNLSRKRISVSHFERRGSLWGKQKWTETEGGLSGANLNHFYSTSTPFLSLFFSIMHH